MRSLRRLLSLLFACSLLASALFAQSPDPDCNAPGRPPVNPKLCKHSNFFEPAEVWDLQTDARISKYKPAGLAYDAYLPVGYDLANTIVLINHATKAVVIVDTLGDRETTASVLAELASKGILASATKVPFRSLIYTHNHIDHTGGVQGFIDAADRPPCTAENPSSAGPDGVYDADAQNPNCVPVIGQADIVNAVINTGTIVGTIINQRSSYMYGSYLLPNGIINDGIGPQVNPGHSGFRMPSRTFTNHLHVHAGGLWMELEYVPSETNDELMVFLPDALNRASGSASPNDPASWKGPGLLLSAEVIQGPSFPNLYSLRGTSYRNPATWFRSVDVLRKYDAWCMLPSHGTPLCGQQNIQTVLRNFRDAIQYTHDQTVRYLNKGLTIEELPQHIHMPQYLIDDLAPVETAKPPAITDPRDYLTFFYGSVPQAIREIYFGYLGWFQGDPVALDPLPPAENAQRTLALMGGATRVVDEASKALKSGTQKEIQWAAQLATLVLQSDAIDAATRDSARKIKASAYRQLAPPQTNPNWRNWYISSERELNGLIPNAAINGGLTSRDIVINLPAEAWINEWTMRLKADESMQRNLHRNLGIWISGDNDGFGPQGFLLRIRRAICEFTATGNDGPAVAAGAQLILSMDRPTLNELIAADVVNHPASFDAALTKLIGDGRIQVTGGGAADAVAFFANFDPAPSQAIRLSGQ
jgi:alkyl sulfatase BDS1-like metallo-beta-lactamase superfamily hydrolase